MVECISRLAKRSLSNAWKNVAYNTNGYRNGKSLLSLPNSTTLYEPNRCFYVPPATVDLGLVGLAAYYLTKCTRQDTKAVQNIFGPMPGSPEYKLPFGNPLRCIAQGGAAIDAPENSMEAFKYCIDNDCKFVEIDVRSTKDGKLILLNDQGLDQLCYCNIYDVNSVEWDVIKNINIASKHPKRHQYNRANLCLLDDALDFLLEKKVKVLIDIKERTQCVVEGILNMFTQKFGMYENVAITCVNPWVMYEFRNIDPNIVAALKYQPYAFSARKYNAKTGPTDYKYSQNIIKHASMRCADVAHTQMWRRMARWCGVSAVLLHKDIVSPYEIKYWRDRGVWCIGWGVDSPVEKLYWRKVLHAPYIAGTLVGEPDAERPERPDFSSNDTKPDHIVNSILEDHREIHLTTL